MKSANLAYFSRLDHLRLAASLWVFIFHLRFAGDFPGAGNELTDPVEILKLWVDNGRSGVSLFLVLSGFLFCLIGLNSARPIRYCKAAKSSALFGGNVCTTTSAARRYFLH